MGRPSAAIDVDLEMRPHQVMGGATSFFVSGVTDEGFASAVVPLVDPHRAVVAAEPPGVQHLSGPVELSGGAWATVVELCPAGSADGEFCFDSAPHLVTLAVGERAARTVGRLGAQKDEVLLIGAHGDDVLAVVRRSSTSRLIAMNASNGEVREYSWEPPAAEVEDHGGLSTTYERYCVAGDVLWGHLGASDPDSGDETASPTRAVILDLASDRVIAENEVQWAWNDVALDCTATSLRRTRAGMSRARTDRLELRDDSIVALRPESVGITSPELFAIGPIINPWQVIEWIDPSSGDRGHRAVGPGAEIRMVDLDSDQPIMPTSDGRWVATATENGIRLDVTR